MAQNKKKTNLFWNDIWFFTYKIILSEKSQINLLEKHWILFGGDSSNMAHQLLFYGVPGLYEY